MKGFVLDNYLEPEKILLDVNTEKGEEDELVVNFYIFRFISPENNRIRIFKCNTLVISLLLLFK